MKKVETSGLRNKFHVLVKNDTTNTHGRDTLHYWDNVRIAPVVITAKAPGIVLTKDEAQRDSQTSIG